VEGKSAHPVTQPCATLPYVQRIAWRKKLGEMAELAVAADLSARGYRIAIPYGEDSDYDLIVERDGQLERVQVKCRRSDGRIVQANCYSNSLTNGKVIRKKRYTARTIDWLAVYDATTRRCFYIPASELGEGRSSISLRLVPAANNQVIGTRSAEDYEDFPPRIMELKAAKERMEPAGLEPATSSVQGKRSPN
jgi:hypothetical protein